MNIFHLFYNWFFTNNFFLNFILEIIFLELSFIFWQKTFKVQLSKKEHLGYFLTNLICFSSTHLLGICQYAFFLMLITSIVYMIYVVKVSTLKLLSYFSFLSIAVINLQFGIFNLLASTNSCHSYFEMLTLPISTILLIISLAILGFLIFMAQQHFKMNYLFIHSLGKNSNLLIAVCSLNLLLVYTIFTFFFEILSQNIFYILTLNIFFYISFDLILHLCYVNYTKQKMNNLKLCNKSILNLYDNTRAFKHDFHNILQAIGGYVITNDMEGLKKYYTQVSKDCISSNNLSKLNQELINNPAIYNILVDKYHMANNHNIQINLDVMLDLNSLHMNIYELTRILGILLDNAIEASKECQEKTINIAFKQDQKKQILIIENTYNNKQICIDKIFEKDYTTKPHNTGLGLWEVKKILSKNDNLNLYTTTNHDYFSQQLEIYSA